MMNSSDRKDAEATANVPQERTSDVTDDEDESTKIAQAVRFWTHPSLRDIPLEQKQNYLREKGVTDAQIHKAWDQIVEEAVAYDSTQAMASEPPSTIATTPQSGPATQRTPAQSSYPLQPSQDRIHSAAAPPVTNPYYPNNPTPSYPTYSSSMDPYQYQSMPPQYEDDGPGPFLQGVSLVTMGGMLGLTAAGAARWLNGGDFQLFPPPALPGEVEETKRKAAMQQQQHRHPTHTGTEEDEEQYLHDQDEDYIDDDDEEEDGDVVVPKVQQRLLEQMESISDSIKGHVSVQEKMLQKLSTHGSSITNQSMNLLRSSSTIKEKSSDEQYRQLWSQLVEIKTELRGLQFQQGGALNGNLKPWEDQLTNVLARLESCIESVEGATKSSAVLPKDEVVKAPSPKSTDLVSPTPVIPLPVDGSKISSESDKTSKDTDQVPMTYTLRQSVRRMAENNDATTLRVGAQLLYLYIINLAGKPDNPRYRKIFTTNDSFQKVEKVIGGKELLLAVGFEEQTSCLEWLASNPSPEQEGLAMAKLQEAAAALGILKSGKPSTDLTERATAVLSPDDDVQLRAPPPSETSDANSLASSPQANAKSIILNGDGGKVN